MPGSFKDLTQTIIFSEGCRETWFPLGLPCLYQLARFIDVGGISRLVKGYSVLRSDLNYHVLIYIDDGELEWDISGERGTATAGELIFIPSHVPHRYWVETECGIHWLHLKDVPHWSSLQHRPPAVYKVSRESGHLRTIMQIILDETSPPTNSGGRILDEEIITSCSRTILRYVERHTSICDESAEIRNALESLWREVDSSLAHPWGVKELAEAVSMSESTLARAVNRLYESTPMGMVESLRIRRAKELLRTGLYTLEQMAGILGYSSQYSLSRAFHRLVGLTPSRYRKAMAADRQAPE